jgi:hypothetical protein
MHTLRCTLATATAEAGFDQKERQIAYIYTYTAIGDRVMQGDGESFSYRKSATWRPADPLHNPFPSPLIRVKSNQSKCGMYQASSPL